MTVKELSFLMLSMLLAIAPFSANAEDSEKAASNAGSQVLGKGGGMGKSYQQNVAGPGQGTPESRGSADGASSKQDKPENATQAEGAEARKELEREQEQVQTQEEVRSQKSRDGSGYGAGPGGERGLGSDGAPHHKQPGSPPRGAGK